MVDADNFQRNIRLVRQRMIEQLESSLKKGANYIDQELASPHNVIIRPIVKSLYDTFVRPDIKKGSKSNLELCIEAGKEAVLDPTKDFEAIIEKFFPQYLKNDQTAKYCNKSHKNYKWFVENTKNTFKAQVKQLVTVLQCDDPNVATYNDLMIVCYQDPDVARQILSDQIKYMEMGIQKIENDPRILNIGVGRDLILRVLTRGMKDTKEELLTDIDVIFKART